VVANNNEKPSPNGNGIGDVRGKNGRFAKGHKGGPGNPLGKKIEKLRAALVRAVTDDDIRQMAKGLIRQAKRGSPAAATVLWDRIFGRAKQPIELSGKDGKMLRAKIIHAFDFDRYGELHRRVSGRIAEPSNGNGTGQSVHTDRAN
jgi:hypothetical protein